MSNTNNNAANSGVSFCGLLFLAFLILKLCGVINWSWWWVTAPLWGGFALLAAIAIIAALVLFVDFLVHKMKKK